jgi:hypothetical protein
VTLNKKVQNDIIVVGFHLIANSKFTGTTHMDGNVRVQDVIHLHNHMCLKEGPLVR